MSERKYSVSEIDQMRHAVRDLASSCISMSADGNTSCWTVPGDKTVEERLRTYLLAGTEPAELIDAAVKHKDRR